MFFVDTNVLVYAFDLLEPPKRLRARDLLARLYDAGLCAISAQVLGELYNSLTRRIQEPLLRETARDIITQYARSWPVYDISAAVVIEAARGAAQHELSYWDGLIWAAAKVNGLNDIISEDFSPGLVLEGVRFINPFHPQFEFSELGL